MKYTKTLFCLLFLLSCQHKTPTEPNGQNQVPQWPMFGGNLRNTSNAADPMEYYAGPQQGEIIWSWKTSEFLTASPTIGPDGTIYIAASPGAGITADSGFVYAFHPDGSMKWRFRTDGPNLGTGAVGLDGAYFYPSLDGHLYAINADGTLRWKKEFRVFVEEARPAINKSGQIIIAAAAGVTALNTDNGDAIWTYAVPINTANGVSIDSEGNIYTGVTHALLALSPAGEKQWEFGVNYGPEEVAIGADGTLYFQVSRDTLLYALNPSGMLKWTFNLGLDSQNHNPGISPAGNILAITPAGTLFEITPDGQLKSRIELTQSIGRDFILIPTGIPIIDKAGITYLSVQGTGGDNLFAISQAGTVVWSLTLDRAGLGFFSKPAIALDGTLYVAGNISLNAIR